MKENHEYFYKIRSGGVSVTWISNVIWGTWPDSLEPNCFRLIRAGHLAIRFYNGVRTIIN
jgi:hypothetical protein